MYKRDVKVMLPNGLHLRPAAAFVKCAQAFKADLDVAVGDKTVKATSVFGLQSLGIAKGTTVTLSGNGVDEQAAVTALETILTNDQPAA